MYDFDMNKRSSILGASAVFAAFIVLLLWLCPPSGSLNAYHLDPADVQFRAVQSNSFSFRFEVEPSDGKLSQQFYDRQSPGKQRRFLYTFDAQPPFDVPLSFYIPSGGGTMHSLVNGGAMQTSQAGSFWAPAWGQDALVVDVKRNVLMPGRNRLDLYITDDIARTGLPAIYFGPREAIREGAEAHQRWMLFVPSVVLVGSILGLILSTMGVIFGRRKSLMMLLGFLCGLTLFQSLFSQPEWALWLTPYAGPARIGLPIAMLAVIGFLAVLARHDERSAWWLSLMALAAAGPALSLTTLLGPFHIPSSFLIAVLTLVGTLPLILAVTSHSLFQDLSARRSRLEDLSQKVSEQSVELDEKTSILVKEMRSRAILEERQRFTRDIHDGIGGQLLSLLLRIRTGKLDSGDIASELQAGLHDLRLVVDSLDNVGENLADALSTFERRAQPQMKAAGIDLHWEEYHALEARIKSAGGTLNLFRFMQEALTNIVRHSGAKIVHVNIAMDEGAQHLNVAISDDGKGFDWHASDGVGKGLTNMKARALSLKAELDISRTNGPGGSVIGLSIPVETVTDANAD